MKPIAMLLAASSLLLSCHAFAEEVYGQTYQVYLEPTFSPFEQASIGEALEEWIVSTRQTKRPIHFNVVGVSSNCSRDKGVDIICLHKGAAPEQDANAVGWTVRQPELDSSDIWVKTDLIGSYSMTEVFAHEIGHAMGLTHSGNNTLMCWNVICSAPKVTAEDVGQYLWLRSTIHS